MPHPLRNALLLTTALCVALLAQPAIAQSRALTLDDDASDSTYHLGAGAALQWNPAWPKVGAWEYVLTGGAAAVSIAAFAVGPDVNTPATSSLQFDEAARDTLRADTRRGRLLARDTSDVLVAIIAAYPVMGDSLVNATWYRDSPEVGGQLTWIYLEAAALTAAAASITKAAVGRQRPFGRRCGDGLPNDTWDCYNRSRYFSHFSGHASSSFAAASVTCVYHHYLPLLGGGARWAPCAVGYSLAATTAVLRVVADQHYTSDIAMGAAVGTAIGLLVPWLHFRHGQPTSLVGGGAGVTISPTSNGIVATGVF